MKVAMLVALAEAQWIRSYVRLLMGRRMILGPLVIGCAVDPTLSCGLLYLSFGLLI